MLKSMIVLVVIVLLALLINSYFGLSGMLRSSTSAPKVLVTA